MFGAKVSYCGDFKCSHNGCGECTVGREVEIEGVCEQFAKELVRDRRVMMAINEVFHPITNEAFETILGIIKANPTHKANKRTTTKANDSTAEGGA